MGLLSCNSKAESCCVLMSISFFTRPFTVWMCPIVSDYLASFQESICFSLCCEGFPSPASLRIPGDLALTTKVGWLACLALQESSYRPFSLSQRNYEAPFGSLVCKSWPKGTLRFELETLRNRTSFSFS